MAAICSCLSCHTMLTGILVSVVPQEQAFGVCEEEYHSCGVHYDSQPESGRISKMLGTYATYKNAQSYADIP